MHFLLWISSQAGEKMRKNTVPRKFNGGASQPQPFGYVSVAVAKPHVLRSRAIISWL